jgi:uncharacterized DUF497 family protein
LSENPQPVVKYERKVSQAVRCLTVITESPYSKGMDFEWNVQKAKRNLVKHGIDFSDAIRIFLDPFRLEEVDERIDYQEERFKAIGQVEGMIFVVIYTLRGEKYRIISARKATRNERRRYEDG